MAVSEKYKILFIHIPKNAGTSLINKLSLYPHGHYDWRTHPKFNGPYHKFSIVRNPWDRVVSCYEFAKMEKSYWHSKDDHTKHPDYDLCHSLTFKECVRLLQEKPNKFTHPGWKNQHTYIVNDEDKVVVDSVLKMENLDTELNNLFRKLGINENVNIPKTNTSNRGNYKDYYDKESIEIIKDIYQKDINFFNYEFDNNNL
tara:strand:+ start:580 stop:1179 length:600 start_codon:yes stop_codon:yes gene_type:complete